jgi:hypothetical protein
MPFDNVDEYVRLYGLPGEPPAPLESSVSKTGYWIIESGNEGRALRNPTSVYRDIENPACGSLLRYQAGLAFRGNVEF